MASDALVITGATATGKTALAVAVAERLNGEVVSMDSRQVYRGMNIGTAKPSLLERRGIPHHGFDLVNPSERYSAGRFGRDARAWIEDIRRRSRVPILAGGTGFFLKALTEPFFEEPAMDGARRESLKRALGTMDTAELERWAAALDAEALLRGGGRQRLARAVEVALLTGRPLGWWHRNAPPRLPPLRTLVFVLELDRDVLYRRINARVTAMARAGLVEEVRGLVDEGYSAADAGMNATGYIELLPYLAGDVTLDDALEQVRLATRRYARRQTTWLRHQLPPGAIRLDASRPTTELAAEIAASWHGESRT